MVLLRWSLVAWMLFVSVNLCVGVELLNEDFSDGVLDDSEIVLTGDANLGERVGGSGGVALVRDVVGESGTGWGMGFSKALDNV